jgi:hypothetical protein
VQNDISVRIWQSNTGCMGGTKLSLSDDGELAIFSEPTNNTKTKPENDSTMIWSSDNPQMWKETNLLPQCKATNSVMMNDEEPPPPSVVSPESFAEGFTGNYVPINRESCATFPSTCQYSNQDIFSMEIEILNEINLFNKAYSDYTRCFYNSQPRTNPLKNVDPQCSSDALHEVMRQAYQQLSDDLDIYTVAIANLELSNKMAQSNSGEYSIDEIQAMQQKLNQQRRELDLKLNEINQTPGSKFVENKNEYSSTIILYTVLLALSQCFLFYFLFA